MNAKMFIFLPPSSSSLFSFTGLMLVGGESDSMEIFSLLVSPLPSDPGTAGTENTLSNEKSPDCPLVNGFGPKRGC
jgi:hypothetical protein